MTKQAYYYMQGFNIQNLIAIIDYLDRWGWEENHIIISIDETKKGFDIIQHPFFKKTLR